MFPRFTKQNEQQTNKYLSPRMINKSTDNSVNLTVLKLMFGESRNQVAVTISVYIHALFNTYVVLLISDIDIKGSDYFYNKCSSF